jgi:hypothetical protein
MAEDKPPLIFVRQGTRWWRALERYWQVRDEPEQMHGICSLNGYTGRYFYRWDVYAALREAAPPSGRKVARA